MSRFARECHRLDGHKVPSAVASDIKNGAENKERSQCLKLVRRILDSALKDLEAGFTYPPLDFIRHLDQSAHRRDELEQYLDVGGTERDLGVIEAGYYVAAECLAWDSKFFGYEVARVNGIFQLDADAKAPSHALKQMLDRARDLSVRYLMAQVDARDLGSMRALTTLGFQLIETRVNYHRSLLDFTPQERYPTRLATEDDADALAHTAATRINPYDRFHADPFILPEQAYRMMRKWVENSVLHGFADATVVPDVAHPSAFCTAKLHRALWTTWKVKLSQPVFSAVSADFKGWYRKIVSEVSLYLRDEGAEHAYMTTQVTNNAVIRSWEHLGYRFGKCTHVLRILL